MQLIPKFCICPLLINHDLKKMQVPIFIVPKLSFDLTTIFYGGKMKTFLNFDKFRFSGLKMLKLGIGCN